MASTVAGYEYDIFISYRQKDNRHDGWVTEFVDNLIGELEVTFKEDVGVYFDINPHDGLLETHDVDDSLKEKLKCLIFIPIISRTYCDPKSFAWEHEFRAFVEQASHDQFGLKVTLPNGNVASRVLPIRIYDLENSDIQLFESVFGGALRSLDFVYKSPGVNRPLKPSDNPDKNLNKTLYRDQINKVANVVKEIINCQKQEPKKHNIKKDQLVIELTDINESVPDYSVGRFPNPNKLIQKVIAPGKRMITTILLAIILVVIIVLWRLLSSGSGSIKSLTTYATIRAESNMLFGGYQSLNFSISPDGRIIAFSSDKGIQLRSLSDFSTKILEGTEGATQIAFSPDGQSLVFAKDGQMSKIGISGSPLSLIYSKSPGGGISWGIDGYIYFPQIGSGGIWRILANGGQPEQITYLDSLSENAHTWPQLLPDSKTLLFTAVGPSGGSMDSRIIIQELNSRDIKLLIKNAIFGRYLFNGNLLYANNEGNIFIIPFDLKKLKITGEPKAILSGVNTATWGGAAYLSVSETGNLIFLPRISGSLTVLNVVDRSGKILDKDTISSSTLERMGPDWSGINLSTSGNLIACDGRSYGSIDIWVLNLKTGDAERITFDPSEDEFPVWSPDGNAIAYTSDMTGAYKRLFIKNLDSAGNPHLIRTWPRHIHFSSWSPDGKWLAAHDFTSTNGSDCYIISVDSGRYLSVASSHANESQGQFSPNGRWLAFQSDESGRFEIYVVSFPKLENKRQISIDGGILPRWDPGGKYIYYLNNDFLIAEQVEIGNEFRRGKPEQLFQAKALDFRPSPDGQKFYLTRSNTKRPNPPLYLITNWFEEFKKESIK